MENEITKGKTTAIISHLTLFGSLIAITMNLEPKNSFARFYIRQTFGLHLIFHALVIVLNQTLTLYAWEVVFLVYLSSLIFSITGVFKSKKNQIPGIGPLFQKWFTFIS